MTPNTPSTAQPIRRSSFASHTSASTAVEEGFESVLLDMDDRIAASPERRRQQREDEQYVRDAPEDPAYEANRQRYLDSKVPVNKTERAMQLLQKTPGYLTQTAKTASETASSAITSMSQRYEHEGAVGVAKTALTSSMTAAKDLAGSFTESKSVPSATLKSQHLVRKTREGQTYTLPSRQEIAEQGRRKPLKDLSLRDEEEEWEPDEEMEEMSAQKRERWDSE
jgi:hypothetical protein